MAGEFSLVDYEAATPRNPTSSGWDWRTCWAVGTWAWVSGIAGNRREGGADTGGQLRNRGDEQHVRLAVGAPPAAADSVRLADPD